MLGYYYCYLFVFVSATSQKVEVCKDIEVKLHDDFEVNE